MSDGKRRYNYLNGDPIYPGQKGYEEAELEEIFLKDLKSYKWQPISTAPKDGTWFLGWDEGFEICKWSDKDRYDLGDYDYDEGFAFRTQEHIRLDKLTHWMPLPPNPENL